MDNFLDTKIAEIVNVSEKPFQQITLRIECPLDSGIKVECWRIANGTKHSQTIPGGVRIFFQFVEKLHKEQPSKKFNVVEFRVENTGKYTIAISFDALVQKQAEENIKQE